MNKIIEQELKKVKATKINYTEGTNIYIPKTTEIINEAIEVGNVYLVELDDILLTPSNNSLLATNWNAGKIPTHKIYKAEIISKMNGMLKVNAIPNENGTDILDENFFGWWPIDNIKIIEKL